MADPVPRPIWNWVSKAWRSMDDLAEKIDDLICSFEGGGDTTMDTVAMYMFGWMLVGLFVVGLGKFVYARFFNKSHESGTEEKSVAGAVTPAAPVKAEVGEAVPAKEVPVGVAAPKALTASPSPLGSRYVPPTPPTRKRLGSRSGRPPPSSLPKSKSSLSLHPTPSATGPDSESVKWVNELFAWLYSDLVIVYELLNVWIQSLNEFTKKSVAEHGVGVEFVRVLSESPSPNINNVFCECAPNDDVTITCDCEATPALQLKVFRQKGEKIEISHYRLNVNRFRARLHILAISEKLQADVKCDGWPEIKVNLAPVGAIKNNLDETQLQDVITEIVTSALRNSNVHLNLSQYPTCPRLLRNSMNPSPFLPLHYDSMSPSKYKAASAPEKRLLVKVIKATGLGGKQGCAEPYCIVEVDEPSQKNQTSIKKDTKNPMWDEQFLFDINEQTAELLLEVYDRCKGEAPKFLGLGIVSMDELIISPSQRQTMALQATPMHEQDVSGTLTVEFLLIEGAEIPMMGDKPFKLKETLPMTPPGASFNPYALKTPAQSGVGRSQSQANKSTLIIHSVQRQGTHDTSVPPPPAETQDPTELNDRGRSRRRKRDFFGTLRRRLNKSKTRSKSAGPGDMEGGDDLLARSISADRARDPSAHSTISTGSYLSVPGLRDSERSSLSEASGISGASSRTYVNEASTLVLETIENGIKKYYLVPLSLAQRSRWKKKGTKLHIFNDHTFIAKHLPGGTACQVCKKALARRLGKQGYECRDCQMRCHKHCHVRAETTCPTTNIHNIELSLLPVLSE